MLLQTPACSSAAETFGFVFGRKVAAMLRPLPSGAGEEVADVSGWIGQGLSSCSGLQFVLLNKQRVSRASRLHRCFGDLLGGAMREAHAADDGAAPLAGAGRLRRHAVFLVHITCPRDAYVASRGASGLHVTFRCWDEVLAAVHRAVAVAGGQPLLATLGTLRGAGWRSLRWSAASSTCVGCECRDRGGSLARAVARTGVGQDPPGGRARHLVDNGGPRKRARTPAAALRSRLPASVLDDGPRPWSERTDGSGRTVYVDEATGNSAYADPRGAALAACRWKHPWWLGAADGSAAARARRAVRCVLRLGCEGH